MASASAGANLYYMNNNTLRQPVNTPPGMPPLNPLAPGVPPLIHPSAVFNPNYFNRPVMNPVLPQLNPYCNPLLLQQMMALRSANNQWGQWPVGNLAFLRNQFNPLPPQVPVLTNNPIRQFRPQTTQNNAVFQFDPQSTQNNSVFQLEPQSTQNTPNNSKENNPQTSVVSSVEKSEASSEKAEVMSSKGEDSSSSDDASLSKSLPAVVSASSSADSTPPTPPPTPPEILAEAVKKSLRGGATLSSDLPSACSSHREATSKKVPESETPVSLNGPLPMENTPTQERLASLK